MEGDYSFIYDPEILNIRQVPSFFFTEKIGVLSGELVGTNSPQARNLFIKSMIDEKHTIKYHKYKNKNK